MVAVGCGHEDDIRIVIHKIIEFLRSHDERSRHLVRIGSTVFSCDDTAFGQIYHAVGHHVCEDTEILFVFQCVTDCCRYGSDSDGNGGTVRDQRSTVFSDGQLFVGKFRENQFAQRLIAFDKTIDF